jgi:hypothetical protein
VGNRNPGPLGTDTNRPPIDPQTSARTRNLPPGYTGSLGPILLPRYLPPIVFGLPAQAVPTPQAPPPYFDVSRLLAVHASQNWTEGRSFLQFWLDGNKCIANVDKAIGKSTIGANLNNPCIRTYTLSWDWLLKGRGKGFDTAKSAYNNLLDPFHLFSDAARAQIVKAYGKTPGVFGEWLSDGLKPEQFKAKIRDHQLQRSDLVDATGLNDVGASLANFYYYVFYQGETISSDQFNSRSNDLLGSPTVVSQLKRLMFITGDLISGKTEDVAGFYKKLGTLVQAVIIVKAVGIYVGDVFEFNGDQYLGHWDLTKGTVSAKFWHHKDPDDVQPDKNGVIEIGNATFRRYRDHTGRGGDFLVFSPIKLVPIEDRSHNGGLGLSTTGDPVILVPK